MSCAQARIFTPCVELGVPYQSSSQSSHLCPSYLRISAISRGKNTEAFPKIVCSTSKFRKLDIICLAKGGLRSDSENFSFDPLKKSMGGAGGEQSSQDFFREQMRKLDSGGNGGNGGRTGGGGGGSGGPRGDENFSAILDELLQVILATIGFIFLYVYLIRGAELTRLGRDYVKYLFGANPTMRLETAMEKWDTFCARFIRMGVLEEEWLQQGILSTYAWLQKPKELVKLLRSREYMKRLL